MRKTTRSTGFSEETQAPFEVKQPPAPTRSRWLEKAELDVIGRKAAAWLEANKSVVDGLPTGIYILIDVETGGYVTDTDRDAARAEFDRRFGASSVSFAHRVRMPTTIGGGWWALHSGA